MSMRRTVAASLATAVTIVILSGEQLSAQEPETFRVTEEELEREKVYSPYAGRNYPDQILFGDTHFHTNLSFDAGLVGTRRSTTRKGFS